MNKTNMKKRAQLTFFILLGFVIIIIMAILFYVTKQQAERKTETQAGLSQQSTYDLVTLNSFISTCLEKTTKDGMKLLGEQGGVIYPSQGGVPLPDYVPQEIKNKYPMIGENYAKLYKDAREVNVSYGLTTINYSYICELPDQNISCIPSISSEAQDGSFIGSPYPWISFPDPIDPKDRECKDAGCFGLNNLPPLDKNDMSMYNQLQVYINNTIEKCLDFSSFETFKGFKIEKNGTQEVNVTTSNTTVVAVLKYPLLVTDSSSRKSTRLDYFYYDTKIRLKKLHDIAIKLVNMDKNYENFDIVNNGKDLANGLANDDKINITIIHKDSTTDVDPFDDNIVRLTDSYAGKAFIFQFARQNRYPALERIQSPIYINLSETINESFLNQTNANDPDDIIVQRYYLSSEGHLQYLPPQQSFSFTLDPINDCFGTNNFTITTCVSDNNYPVPCSDSRSGDVDQSKDWQHVTFIIVDC